MPKTVEDTGATQGKPPSDELAAAGAEEIVVPKALRETIELPEKMTTAEFEKAMDIPERSVTMLPSFFLAVQGEGKDIRTVQTAAMEYKAALLVDGKTEDEKKELVDQARKNLQDTVSASVESLKKLYAAKDPELMHDLKKLHIEEGFDPSSLDDKKVLAIIEAEAMNQADMEMGLKAIEAKKQRAAAEGIAGGEDVGAVSAPKLPNMPPAGQRGGRGGRN